MSDWINRLADVDDDYLIGISNKGIVKRAYKDKGEVAAQVQSMGEEACVAVGEETVTVRYPLAESKCTCPSRSICRHVVQAILVLKESCSGGRDTGAEAEEDANGAAAAEEDAKAAAAVGELPEQNRALGQEEVRKQEQAPVQGEVKVQNPTPVQGESRGQNLAPVQGESRGQNLASAQEGAKSLNPALGQGGQLGESVLSEERPEPHGLDTKKAPVPSLKAKSDAEAMQKTATQKTPVWKEINDYPLAKLKKILGVRQFQTFVNQVAAGIHPPIKTSSVVTVQLPQQGYTVKLLSPLEYSTCSCHKKELCVHKAAAILWCQLETGTLTKETLLGEIVETQEYDMERVKDAAGQMKIFLEELFATGLSRTSPDVLDYLERLAIISHNEGLARFEGYFRALSDSYDRYLARKAAFRTEDLMAQIARLYRRVELLLQAEDTRTVARLAGEFRADYIPVGNLDLIGVAMEHFESQTGYEGETIYFLEESTKKWYTYTNARPVFYDSKKRRGYTEKSQAPWGLNLSFENLLKVRIHLTGAKCDERNRLSSSQETKGEVTGEQGLKVSDIGGWYYRDFGNLFSGQIGKQQKAWLAEQGISSGADGQESTASEGTGQDGNEEKGVELVFVQPDSCAKAEFSQTGQQLTLPLYDKAGRELLVEVTYSKQESGTIRYLERISERKLPCFLGKVYLKDGRVRMYPVDLLEIEEPMYRSDNADGQEAVQKEEGKGDGGIGRGENITAGNPGEETDTGNTPAGNLGEDQNPGYTLAGTGQGGFMARKSKYEVMEDLTGEVLSLMEDLYQSGFDTVHESTLKDIQKSADLTEQYGMKYLSELLAGMAEEISQSRHRMEKKTAALAKFYVSVSEYLYLCSQKAAYDRGQSYYM